MTAWLYEANALDLPLDDNSGDLVVTSPPYYALRSYQDGGKHYEGQIGSEATAQEWLDALWAATAECIRVLKPSGSIFVDLGDRYVKKGLLGLPWRYAIGCIDDLGLILRAEVIWSKPNAIPESIKDRVRRSHDQWFHFTLEPRYFSAIDEIREPYTSAPAKAQPSKAFAAGATRNPALSYDHDLKHNPLGKLPGSVWSIPTEPLRVPADLGVEHVAAFPQEWPRRLILGGCPAEVCTACGQGRAPVVDKELVDVWHDKPVESSRYADESYANHPNKNKIAGQFKRFGKTAATIVGYACACPDTTAPSTPGVVLDPFCGTGTVPMVAHALGRTGIGVDLSGDYLRLARWRVFESGHAQKCIDRTAANVRARNSEGGG